MYFPSEYNAGDSWGSAEDFEQKSTLNDLVYKVNFLIEENQKNKAVIRGLLNRLGVEIPNY